MANTRQDNPNKVKRIGVKVPKKIARRIQILADELQKKETKE